MISPYSGGSGFYFVAEAVCPELFLCFLPLWLENSWAGL
jgi:hypothetical protein